MGLCHDDGLANGRTLISLSAGAHTLSVAETADISGSPVEVRLAWVTPTQQQVNHDAAVAAAKSAKTAVVFAWPAPTTTSPNHCRRDRTPDRRHHCGQSQHTGRAQHEPAGRDAVAVQGQGRSADVVPGDRGGYATANVLTGQVNPGGKLPFTWPASIAQEVAHQAAHPERSSNGIDSTGKPCAPSAGGPFTDPSCVTTYSEGIDVGYRFYDATNATPLFRSDTGCRTRRFAIPACEHRRRPTAG